VWNQQAELAKRANMKSRASVMTEDDEYNRNLWKQQAEMVKRNSEVAARASMKSRASVMTEDDEYHRNVWMEDGCLVKSLNTSRESVMTDDAEYSRNLYGDTLATPPADSKFVTTHSRSMSSGRSEISIAM
jgi:hypothetical protein